jgi:uncharacterized membrane protein YbhN (UPF0104 family)
MNVVRIAAGFAVAALIAVMALTAPRTFGEVARGFGRLSGANPLLLGAAALGFLASAVSSACAWRTALLACGVRAPVQSVAARYAVGGLASTFSPAPAGEAVRVALISRLVPAGGGAFTVTGIWAIVGGVRATLTALLFVGATLTLPTGALPAVLLAGTAVVAATTVFLFRDRLRTSRIAQLADAAKGLARAPRLGALLVACVVAGIGARVLAAGCSAAALGVGHPWAAGFVIVAVLEVATMIPLTPGNIGVTTAAVAVALQHRHVGFAPAIATGIALHAVETLAGITFGIAGVLAIGSRKLRRRIAVATLIPGLAALAGLLGVWMVDLA